MICVRARLQSVVTILSVPPLKTVILLLMIFMLNSKFLYRECLFSVLSSDMTWSSNTEYLFTRCNKKLWILWRPKKLGANQEDLTGEDRLKIERIQKFAFCILLGGQYRSYSFSLKILKMNTLYSRRTKLFKKFARKAATNKKFSQWFKPSKKLPFTRRKQCKYYFYLCIVYSWKN